MAINIFKKHWISILSIALVLLVLSALLIRNEEPDDYLIDRVVQYGFQIENRSNEMARDVEFWTYAPVKLTSTQKLEKITVSHPYELIEDEIGNQVVHIKFDVIPPFATKIVDIQAELSLSDEPNSLPLESRGRFLRAEKFIETDHDEIKKIALLFPGEDVSDLKAAYEWTADHIQGVEYVREDRGALYALQNKAGDCTEYAYLFTALSRANGIPARPLGGYVLAENGRLAADAYHNWAEFYLDGAWYLADPQLKVFMERPSRFVAMHVISDSVKNPMQGVHRFRFTGDNLFVTMR